ncbi:hypothetical protein [uncultured Kordia sp.]|uniref:hypothetical protein n=1 Tax=uncultured Kordia sp. TaxID=507699 RepID=UPI00262172C1|nr:hypothetical protein [uncultured Kordia sp.]
MKTTETKEPYLHILNSEGNIYEEFLPDQVLTHKNLNKIVNYFEDQDRLSRIYLTGVGVGCGLNIVSFSNKHIEIGQGVGITTDGDIIKSETRRFHYYSTLTDKADYSLFRQGQKAEGELKVYELYEQEATGRPGDELPLASFSINEATTLKDCIVIAYVETYTEDEGLCGGGGCDETGNKVFSNLKFLITHQSNKQHLIGKDTIYQNHDVLDYYDNLPDLCVPRIILTKENTNVGFPILEQYKKTFELKDDLYLGISTIIRKFSPRINFQKFGVLTTDIATYIDTIFSKSDDEHVQYRYDLLRDLVDTYREIKELILHSKFECVPNIKAFPKHLLLGTPELKTRVTTRHQFYPSPMVSENDENLLGIRALCIRFYYQLKEFNIINFESAQIKITPSKSYDKKLSERSIPYYYKSGKSLVNNWNPTSIKNRKANYQLGYNTGNLKDIDCIKNPLNYSHLDKDFYRIEGHQGKNFVIALKNILKKKAQYNLPFDVKAISINFPVNNISLDEDTCETKEYVTLLKTWVEEFNCVANRAIDFFGRYEGGNLGVNDTKADIHTVLREESQNDKSFLESIEDIKLGSLNINSPLANIRNTKLTGNAATLKTTTRQKLSGIQRNQLALAQINIGQELPTKFSTLNTYRRSLSFLLQSIIDSINPENLTADFVANEVIARFERFDSNQKIDTESDDFKLYIEIPTRIISHLEIVKYRFIRQLQDVYVTERWTAFHSAFADLCKEVEKVLYTLSTVTENDTFGKKVHDKMYEFLIHKVAGLCCLKEKFNWLKEQLDDIRSNLYKELILSKFVEQHPGLEHMAGVPKGGTFLMVYIGEQKITLEEEDVTVETFERGVLLDFALPYMCKSMCAPETIVYSDVVDPVTLAIARKKFCLPSNSEQENFIIEPERGVVTSPDGTAFIITTAEGYAFDPTKVPDALLGEGIQFLVDGKIPTIPIETVVYKLPENVTAAYEFVAWTDDGLVINLNVTHELEDLLYLQHTWKRVNGSQIAIGENPTNILIITDEIIFQEDITLVIDVNGNPVPCKLEILVSINEEREIIEVDIDMAREICYNIQETTPIPETISVVPSEGILTSPQEPTNGQSFIESFDGVYSLNPLFVPASLAGEPITFEVDGIPVEGFETRVYLIPGFITTDREVISWDANGVNIRLIATHPYIDKSYLAYEWLNENDEIIGNSRIANFRINTTDGSVNTTVRVRTTVIGTENQLCNSGEFPLIIEESRPEITVSIPPAICWIEDEQHEPISIIVSDDQAELICPIQEEVGAQILNGEPGNYRFEIIEVPNELVGVPIVFEIGGNPVASTIVYKVPSSIEARYNNASWNGNTLSIDIQVTHSLEGQIDTIEDYLQYTWKDEQEAIILTEKEQINFEIVTDDGSISENYTLDIQVKNELIENPCEHTNIAMVIEENRPNVTVTIASKICHIEALAGVERYPIVVTPSTFSVSSPDGSAFIQGSIGNYSLNPALVPEELLGQEIRFIADGEVKASTEVYKIPELVRTNINTANEVWGANGLAIDLSTNITDRRYYKYEWYMRSNNVDVLLNKINEPNRYLIPDAGDGVNVEIFLRVSANTNNIVCSQETVKTRITRHRPISVSKDRFCIPDTPVVFRGISTDVGLIESTTRLLPTDVITENDGKYVFNPDRVTENFWGVTLRFSVGGTVQSGVAIKVYNTPNKESIVQDVQASQWVPGGYEFVFTHDLISKSYFSYTLILQSNDEELEKVGTHRYFIPTSENMITDKVAIKINISDEAVGCKEDQLITVDTIRPEEPSERLDCSTPYNNRLTLLGASTLLKDITELYKGQNFQDDIKTTVLDPLNQIVNGIIGARNINSITEGTTNAINNLRKVLGSNFYNNPNIESSFYKSFLALDEIIELVILELLRCVSDVNSNTIIATDKFFLDSQTINSQYIEKPRHTIDSGYISKYTPVITMFKTKVDATYGTKVKPR